MKLFKLILISFFMLFSTIVHAVEQKDIALVNKVVEAFRNHDIVSISKLVSYPLEREYPIPAIKNEREFIQRFKTVFDTNLFRMIVTSDASTDWNQIGWRGFMLDDGDVWLDHDGKISAINYQSQAEEEYKIQITARGRRALHRSVNSFAESVLEWKTERFHIRVDDVGEGKLRYASWPIGAKMSDKPDLILMDGKLEYDGSGRNHRYIFNNGNFSYQLKVNNITTDTISPRLLQVFKGNQSILSESAIEVN